MKSTSTLSLFFITALLFQGLAAAWQFPSLQFPLVPTWLGGAPPTPDVPQFVLDARHPWLETHASELAGLDDPTSLLCAHFDYDPTLHPEATNVDCGHDFDNKPLDGSDVPGDFFRRLEIDNNRVGIDRRGWDNARQRLLEMRACPRALEEVREIKVDIWVHDWEWKTPPSDVPRLFAEVLSSMKSLEKIDWTLRGHEENLAFGKAFAAEGGSLSAREVAANMYATWLLDASPSVRVLKAKMDDWGFSRAENHFDYYKTWLGAASKLKELRGLNLGSVRWDADMTELIPELFPELEELWIGSLEMASRSYDRKDGDTLKTITRALAEMPNLKKLHLPYSSELDLGFDGGPFCGNAYDGEDGERLRRQVEMDGIEAAERAGEIVRAEFPRLKGVEVGRSYGNFTVDGEGRDVIVWPWSGRVEEWVMNEYYM